MHGGIGSEEVSTDKNNVLIFKYNYIIYRIPYSDINYIEKEINVKIRKCGNMKILK